MAHPGHYPAIRHAFGTKRARHTVDSMAYVIGIGGNLAVLPQIGQAWASKAPGLSIVTWVLFTVFSGIWLIYAVQHKQKPLIAAQLTCMMVNVAVVLGWVFNNVLH